MAVKNFNNGAQAVGVRGQINNGTEINSQFNLASISANADYNLDLDTYYATTAQSKISIQFPSAIVGASNARLSLDNGTTYANIVDDELNNVIGTDVQNTFKTLVYNGTVWIITNTKVDLSNYNIKTYSSLTQIGATTGNSLSEVYNLMPDNSILETEVTIATTLGGDLPQNIGVNCVLKIERVSSSSGYIRTHFKDTGDLSLVLDNIVRASGTPITLRGWLMISGTILEVVNIAPNNSYTSSYAIYSKQVFLKDTFGYGVFINKGDGTERARTLDTNNNTIIYDVNFGTGLVEVDTANPRNLTKVEWS